MNKKEYKSFNEKEKEILNEISDENTIYEETQCGPQEESFVLEQKIDVRKWKNAKKTKKNN